MIVLDTHAWVWWLSDPDRLSSPARSAVDTAFADRTLYVSAISVWEVALLAKRGRLDLTMDVGDWVRRAEALENVTFVPVDNAIALRSVQIAGLHADPADRIIAATAADLGARLVTGDRRLHEAGVVEALW